ncbi:MAG TPA: hypothetical protein VGI85_02185 [Chthoniobacterales bacterium]|jgi:hypothetical protein
MPMPRAWWLLFPIVALVGCAATTETIPQIRVLPNDLGVAIGNFQAHGPYSLLGGRDPITDRPAPPDVPAGV